MKLTNSNISGLIKIVAILTLYCFAFYDAFIAKSEGSFAHGQLKAIVIFIPIFLLILALGTIYYTLKVGGSWRKVRENLGHNLLGLLSIRSKSKK
jgi:hypothetical protein